MRLSWSLLCSLAACASAPEAQPAKAQPAKTQPTKAPGDWQMLARGSLIEVSAERALYEDAGNPHFFTHLRVENLGSAPIGVDLRSSRGVFHANQWGPSRATHRGVVDERRFLWDKPLDAAGEGEIIATHRAGLFTNVPARGVVEYYLEWNAHGRADVDAQSRDMPYVLVVFDGSMRASDGRVAERVDAPVDDEPREVALRAPVHWAQIPPGALVLRDH